MRRLRRLALPATTAAIMLGVLIALGSWQVRRLHWKQGILQAIDRAEAAPAIPLPLYPSPFEKIGLSGLWRSDRYLIYGADVRDTSLGPQMGGELIQPLHRVDGQWVLVDRGWVPENAATPALSAGPVALQGYVRAPEHPGLFTPNDDVAGHRVYTLDPRSMAAALGLAPVAPFTVIELGSDLPGRFPAPAISLPRPPNDHLSYAITWFGLAAVLVVVFGLWTRSALHNAVSDTAPLL